MALAAGKHPFPSRTRPLRLHAVMILRPGARESNASPILILQVPWLRTRPGDFFCPSFPASLGGGRPRRLGWKFPARKRGMYRRRPRRRLGKRAEPALAPRQRRDRFPPSETRRRRRLPKGLPGIVSHLGTVERLGVCVKGRFRALTLGRTNAMASFSCRLSLDYSRCTCFVDNILLVCE